MVDIAKNAAKNFVNKKTKYSKAGKVTEKDCDKDGVTDKSVEYASRIGNGIAILTTLSNIYTTYKMAELQEDISKRYLDLSKQARQLYNDKYKPLEIELIEESTNEPKYERKDDFVRGQMLVSARAATVGELEKNIRCTSRYCTGQRQTMLSDYLINDATIESTVTALARRHEDNEQFVQDNARFERRSNLLKIGRGIPGDAVTYAELAAGVFGSLGAQASKAAVSGVRGLNYEFNRRDTVFNGPHRGLRPTEAKNIATRPDQPPAAPVNTNPLPDRPQPTGDTYNNYEKIEVIQKANG